MRLIRGSEFYYHESPQYIVLKPVYGFYGKHIRGIWNNLEDAQTHAKQGDTVIEVVTSKVYTVTRVKLVEKMEPEPSNAVLEAS